MINQETIVALATPNGLGAISVIRISGLNAISVTEKLFKPKGNKKLSNQTGIFTGSNFSVFSLDNEIELESLNYKANTYSFFLLGFCIPTINCKSKKHSTELVKDLFKQHGFEFINFIKAPLP